MSTTTVTVHSQLTANEVFTVAEAPLAASELNRTVKLSALEHSASLGSTTTPKIDKPPIYKKYTGAGVYTLDLTAAPAIALPGSLTRSENLSTGSAKIRGLIIRCKDTNASVVNVAPGAATPYPLFGTANDIDLGPGAQLQLIFRNTNGNLAAVSGSAKHIDITVSGSDEVEIELLAGT